MSPTDLDPTRYTATHVELFGPDCWRVFVTDEPFKSLSSAESHLERTADIRLCGWGWCENGNGYREHYLICEWN